MGKGDQKKREEKKTNILDILIPLMLQMPNCVLVVVCG